MIEQCKKLRQPLPEKFANAPELAFGLDLYFTAFMELSSCRAVGFAEGPIPWLAIDRWCVVNGIEEEDREDLFYHVQQLDGTYLKHRAAEMKKGK